VKFRGKVLGLVDFLGRIAVTACKKTGCFVIYFLLFVSGIVQSETAVSLRADSSFGLFGDVLDAALDVTERSSRIGFSDIESSYILGNLGNLARYLATSDNQVSEQNPAFIGFFAAGRFPFSLSCTLFADTESDESILDGSVIDEYGSVEDETDPDTDSTFLWVKKTTNTQYSVHQASLFAGSLQYLQNFGPVNAGINCSYRDERGDLEDPTGWAEKNRTVIETWNYDYQEGTPPPDARLDYTKTTVYQDPRLQRSFGLAIPVFFRTGLFGHTVDISYDQYTRDSSSHKESVYSEPAAEGPVEGTMSDRWYDMSDKAWVRSIEAAYAMTMPGFFRGNPSNNMEAGLSGFYDFNSISDLQTSETAENYAVDMDQPTGKRKVLSDSEILEEQTSRSVQDSFGIAGHIEQQLNFEIDGGSVMRIGIIAGGGYSSVPEEDRKPAQLLESAVDQGYTGEIRIDTDGDGKVDLRTVTTRNYLVNSVASHRVVSAEAALPVALKLPIFDWLQLLLCSRAHIGWEAHRVGKADVLLVREKTEVFDAAGDLTSSEILQYDDTVKGAPKYNQAYFEWLITTSNRFCLCFSLANRIEMDVILNWNNLFDFDNLTIQAAVPLP